VLIGAENYYVSAKRKIHQETPRRSYDQQHSCEKECHQQKLSVRIQNEKKRDSTKYEKEFHQPKLSVRVKKKELRDPTICEESHKNLYEKDTQKLSEVEDRSCEETSLSNMTISSSFSFDVMQVYKENEVVNYD
jgi:hydroxymethylpyrimidine pyrophosphatase-like HAD family hydrolase